MSLDVARPLFLAGLPYDCRVAIDRCHVAALAAGGQSEGVPGLRPRYRPSYYGAYFSDPDGNKLCVCCHQPEPA